MTGVEFNRKAATQGTTSSYTGNYVVDRVGFEPANLRTQGTDPTTEPPCHANAM